ncbi:MAG: cyclic GMP-AMP synthase DncV-like nucleotidyltransferase [Flavobacteriales bacterium]
MANCNRLFGTFNDQITVSGNRLEKLKDSRMALQDHLTNYFKKKEGLTTPRFALQGSYKMKTMVQKESDATYDVDLGLYFLEKPEVAPATIQGYVWDAVENWTGTKPEHRSKCIRVIYAKDYHIDIPVYYKTPSDSHPHLATKEGWQDSDPKAFWEWFNQKSDSAGQLKRMIKYLKAWCDARSFKTPSGVALTTWTCERFLADERDDKALANLLRQMYTTITPQCTCQMPVWAFDDLTKKLDLDQKAKFRDALKTFSEDAAQAVAEKNQLKASKLWRKHLGDRFPEGEDKDVDLLESLLRPMVKAAVAGAARIDPAGNVNTKEGVPYKPNRNFGG